MSDADTDATTDEHDTTVLVVDDERGLADLYTIWLEDDYDVKTAYSGTEAIDAIDPTIDVALLDRQMPDVSGDDVVADFDDADYEVLFRQLSGPDGDTDDG